MIKDRGTKRGLVPGAPLVPGALLGTKGEGAREAEETKRKPRRRQRQELNGGGAGRGRKNTQGERRTTMRLGLRPLSPRGKAGTRAEIPGNAYNGTNSHISVPLL